MGAAQPPSRARDIMESEVTSQMRENKHEFVIIAIGDDEFVLTRGGFDVLETEK